MRALSAILCVLTCFSVLPAFAGDTLAYESIPLKLYPKAELLLPKASIADRLYLKTHYQSDSVKAHALIDQHTLINALGSSQTTSAPSEILQNYGEDYTEVTAFPVAPFKTAKKQVTFALELENGKEARITLKDKKLAEFLKNLP